LKINNAQLALNPEVIQTTYPSTEGIKYIGSKLKLIPFILRLAEKVRPQAVFDGFSGTTRVSQAFAKSGLRVIANDSAVWSKVFGQCYLLNKKELYYYQTLINHLNALSGIDGWYTEHYGGYANGGNSIQHDGLKKPWQMHNTRKLDAIRGEIDKIVSDEIEKAVLLTSLIIALDRVDNTIGHFASYVSKWSARSYNEMKLRVPELFTSSKQHEVFQGDIFDILPNQSADLAYFDPPYGSNNEKMPPSRVRYEAYYHIWKTICLDDNPVLFGKTNRRMDSSDTIAGSVFEDFRRGRNGRFVVINAIERLLRECHCQYIILSYSSEGRATTEQLRELLNDAGRMIDCISLDYRRNVMANMKWTHDWIKEEEVNNKEYLFLIEKR
jgi:adenine-specific DNA-methyltransferase